MTPERWRQIDEVVHAYLSLPADERSAFLDRACAGDDALRREVESLLAHEPGAARFMSMPAAALLGSEALARVQGLPIGQRLGPYVVRGLIGVGGMGEVYRAHDSTLDREVAIKVLPSVFSADPERRARFEREARMLATLNHPHIGAIYGVEEAGDIRALVLELVEGPTLAERISLARQGATRQGLPISDALSIAAQIADALDAAHEKGIVHRDLKPANIKITDAGVVKVLDFGLAKGPSADTAPAGVLPSRQGTILGTAAYMSPEQARGHAVDKRTDIWAFGCVLYEMLTGRLAFAGDTESDMLARIIEREPDWSALPENTPPSIRRLLFRCLTKSPKQRLRDVAEARIAIEGVGDVGSETNEGGAPVPALKQAAGWMPWAAAAAVAALAAGAAWWAIERTGGAPPDRFANALFSRFTDWPGTEGGAAISPDGRFVVFLADRDGQFDLWLSQVGTGRFTNLTPNLPSLDPPRSDSLLREFGFSGDGANIWFNPGGTPRRSMIVPLTGGAPRPFLAEGGAAPAWSPNGNDLIFFKDGDGDPLFVADRVGADARSITPPEGAPSGFFRRGMHNHNPAWSGDGDWIYFVHGAEPTVAMEIWRASPSGDPLERVAEPGTAINFLAPLDAGTLLYTSPAADRSGPWLWALDLERHASRRVISGLERYTSVSASRDGRRVVATVANPVASLWRVPLMAGVAGDSDAVPYPVPTARAIAPRFGGSVLFYLSSRGTVDGLWRIEGTEAVEVWKGTDAALTEPPAISPDGRSAAVVTQRGGRRHVAIMASDGTNFRTVGASIEIQGAAGQASVEWSPDGNWIVAGGTDTQGPGLFKIPVDGSAPVRLVTGAATNPIWSPNGDMIVYAGPLVAGQVPLLAVSASGAAVPLPPVKVRAGAYRFLRDGNSIVYLPRRQAVDFWLFDLTTGGTRQLTRFANRDQVTAFDLTPDGADIVFDRSRENSDIVLIDLPQ